MPPRHSLPYPPPANPVSLRHASPGLFRPVVRLLRVTLLGLAALGAGPIAAEEPASERLSLSVEEAAGLATRLFENQQLDEARQLVGLLRQAQPPHPQVLFLSGMLAMSDGNAQLAIEEFRALLARDPSQLRVRLELARALFTAREFDAARYHFEAALGQDLPDNARRNVRHFLQRIATEVSSFSISAALVPDTNINQATRTNTVDILGQTYTLNEDAKARRAVGLALFAGSRHAFGPEYRSFIRTYLEHRDYPNRHSDFTYGQVTAGHSIVRGARSWTLEAGPAVSIYQDQRLFEGLVVQASHFRPLSDRLSMNQTLNLRHLDYVAVDYLTGNQAWLTHDFRYALNPTSGITASVALGRNLAAEAAYAYRAAELRLGYTTDLPRGFIADLRLITNRFGYDADSPLFGVRRSDRQSRVEIDLTKRDLSLWGFAPRFSLSFWENRSNIPLYTYRRAFGGMGLTREF